MNSKRKLIWNSLIYAFKSVLGIVFPLITFPYTSNVLGAENIGKVEYANSISSYFIFLAALGITTYAVREGAKIRDDREALSQFSSELLTINLISSIIAYAGILVVCNLPIFRTYKYLILINSVSILFTTLGMEWVYNIKEEFTFITIRYLIVQIISIIFLFSFVKTANDYYYYAIYIVLTSCGSNIINIFYLKKHVDLWKHRKLSLKKHLKPLLLLFSISITATIFANLDTTMLGIMRGDSEVGIYQAGLRIDKIVTTVIASLSVVVFSRSSYLLKEKNIERNEEYKKLIRSFNGLMMLASAPICIGLVAISKNVIGWLLSDEYSMSAIVLMIISFNVINSSVSRVFGHQVLIGVGKDIVYFTSTVIALIVDIVINYFLIPSLGAIATAISTVVACFVSNIIILIFSNKIIPVKYMIIEDAKYLLLCAPFLLISYFVNLTKFSDALMTVIIIVSCVIYYLITLLLLKDPYIKELMGLLRKGKANV